MKRFNKILVILSAFLSIILCPINVYALSNDNKEINYLTKDETVKVEKFIEKNMKEGNVPGVSISIVKGDKTVYQKGFGYSDLESKKPVNSQTLFEIGSNSKAFTALGILNLEKSGQININDEVTKYIPWLKVKYKDKEVPITIEQLLHQTSGIPFKTIDKIPVSNETSALEETIKTLVGMELDSEPGKKFQYATINYDVLGLIIEKVTGKTYENYIEETILKPMGLNNTYLFKNEAINENIASGYKIGFLKQQLYKAPMYRGNKPAGYIISSGEDMAKWLRIQMGIMDESKFDKDIIKKSQEANRTVSPLSDGSFYASGWFIYPRDDVSHGGNNPNYSSFIIFNPKEKVGVAVLSNTNSNYVQNIGLGINKILQGESVRKDIKDLNKSADKVAIAIVCISSILVLVILYFMIKAVREIFRKQRYFKFSGVKSSLRFIFSFLFMSWLSYCIYLVPQVLYNGVSWKFVFVWLPDSVEMALYSIYIAIWVGYVYFIFTSFFKKEKEKGIILLSLLSVLSGFGNSLIIFTINMAIDSNNALKFKLLVYFMLGIVLYVYGQKIMRERLVSFTNEVVYSKRMKIIGELLGTQYNKFEQIEKGRIETTLNNDTETISRFVNILIGGITSAVTLICCFIYLGTINIYALVLSVLIIVLIASIYYLVGRYANKLGEEARDLQNIFFKFISDLIGGFKELSLNGNRKNEFEKDIEESCSKYKVKRSKSALAFANMFVIGELLFTLAIGSVVFIFPFILKNLNSTSLTSYIFILLYMTGPVHGILNTIPNAIEVKISLKRINSLIDEISFYIKEEENVICREMGDNLSLKLKDVEYEYANTDGQSFKVGPINYEFKSGEIVFITGGNGSGKSTLAKLLTGLYLPAKGKITLNGRTSQKQLSESYSTVFADFYLFDKLYGVNYKGKECEIEKYLEILQLSDKVQIQDGKFSTTKLSTGQKKRLALLVTYLEDRPIYLFDEWAADQDPEFRFFFYNTLLLELKAKGKCVIAVTHDDRYFNIADRVIKMDFGKISDINFIMR
ncbi:cyclic peptide export ABC transporter [Inconstantimicrobium mannanitabidum]|uniref:Uncharacterized protein n=1 Tax=Inconstantimicrobium mannanitabidum TaxID=1604901 RepID=A0ACB5R845_9CLOT|nr:cyclic peptide export ABC transporter [Clostridium sp. TW13]GKX65196.1 hypothetical protein rsdtw13_04540 [Clostridium sp. TW13]